MNPTVCILILIASMFIVGEMDYQDEMLKQKNPLPAEPRR